MKTREDEEKWEKNLKGENKEKGEERKYMESEEWRRWKGKLWGI